MKKYLIAIILVISSSLIFAGESAEVWSRLYVQMDSLEQKYSIMEKIVQLDEPSLELALTNALEELVEGDLYNLAKGDTFDLWYELTKMIVMELGDFKAQSAAPLVYIVMRDYSGLLKAEAMIALGSMNAVEYSQDINRVLRNLNYNTQADKDIAEKEAYGAILGLNRMGESSGFEPVFYAYKGWYSRRVKDMAYKTLLEMVPDPTEEIIKILNTAGYDDKLIALQVENLSNASVENKNRTALKALEQGVTLQGANLTEKQSLADLRLAAMEIMTNNKASFEEAVPMLDRSYTESGSVEEKLAAILALAANGSDRAVMFLVDYLNFFNDRKVSGLSPSNQEELIIRQILFGLGTCGNKDLAMPALSTIGVFDYSNSINRSAKKALENYQ